MNGSNFLQGWVAFAGSLAVIAIILTTLGTMLGIVKPADALRRVGAILGVVMLLMLVPAVLVTIWSGMSLWQRLALAAIGLGIWQWRRPRRQSRKRE
jgi:ABC-type spermidine/putrescine transport system permease subunit II